jgi:hypothetical protein
MSGVDRINLHAPIYELCDRLGIDPNNVGRVNFFPDRCEVMMFRLLDNGAKYVDLDRNVPAVEWREFKVRT